MEQRHRFVREGTIWLIECIVRKKEFSIDAWRNGEVEKGICPYCGENADKEMHEYKIKKKKEQEKYAKNDEERRMCAGKEVKEQDLNKFLRVKKRKKEKEVHEDVDID